MPIKTTRKKASPKKGKALKAKRKRALTNGIIAEPLTKRRLTSAVSRATKAISRKALRDRGYIIVEDEGWVVRLDKQGRKQKLSKIITVKRPKKIVLD